MKKIDKILDEYLIRKVINYGHELVTDSDLDLIVSQIIDTKIAETLVNEYLKDYYSDALDHLCEYEEYEVCHFLQKAFKYIGEEYGRSKERTRPNYRKKVQ